MKSSVTNTTVQHSSATLKRLAPNHAAKMPAISASVPEIGDCVASIIAGKVITASVTYGT